MSAIVPAHLQPAHTPAAPIPFPSRPAAAEASQRRAAADNATFQRRADHLASVLKVASQDGFDSGHRAGYIQGWRWGVTCGACAGGLVMASAWGAWANVVQPWLAAAGWL